MKLAKFIEIMLKRLTEFKVDYESHKDDLAWPDEMDLSDWYEQFMFFIQSSFREEGE